MTKAAMIIHTRTQLCDFPSTFVVAPSVLDSSTLIEIRQQVLSATRSIDSLKKNEIRQMVYTCGNYIVAGIVSFLKNLSDDNIEDEKFFLDEKGRSIYAFVGCLFHNDTQNVPLIDKKTLWKYYKLYMEPVWERTLLETISSDFSNIDFLDTQVSVPDGEEYVSGMILYPIELDGSSIFLFWLGEALKGKNVSFCSNITDFRVVKDRLFNIITTTPNIIMRMKQEVTKTSNNKSSVISSSNEISRIPSNIEKKNHLMEEDSISKNSKNVCLKICISIITALFAVIILIILISK